MNEEFNQLDHIITYDLLKDALDSNSNEIENSPVLIVRTLPNSDKKKETNYH